MMTGKAAFSVDPAEFSGKRALVTGGSKGMGEAVVRRLAAGGAAVAATARSPHPGGLPVDLFVQADIATAAGVEKVADEVLGRFGGVDILIDNAGGSSAPGGGVLALGDEDWRLELDLNLLAAVRMDRRILPGMHAANDLRRY